MRSSGQQRRGSAHLIGLRRLRYAARAMPGCRSGEITRATTLPSRDICEASPSRGIWACPPTGTEEAAPKEAERGVRAKARRLWGAPRRERRARRVRARRNFRARSTAGAPGDRAECGRGLRARRVRVRRRALRKRGPPSRRGLKASSWPHQLRPLLQERRLEPSAAACVSGWANSGPAMGDSWIDILRTPAPQTRAPTYCPLRRGWKQV